MDIISMCLDAPVFLICVHKENSEYLKEIAKEVGLLTDKKFTLASFECENWSRDYSPWEMKGEDEFHSFEGGGLLTLEKIRKEVLPVIKNETYAKDIYIAGYSLAGLFSLWAFYEEESFSGFISGSGTMWFDGIEEYVSNKKARENTLAYLSLGGKEELVDDPVVSTVGKRTRNIDSLISKDPGIKRHKLEMNKGGHFASSSKRLAKGIAWILENRD